MAGPRENLFAAIQAALENISLANGYGIEIGRVFRSEWNTDQLSDGEMPALFVLETLAGDQFTEHDVTGYADKLPILVAGAIRYGGSADLKSPARHTELNALINATWKALLVDPTFGGTCWDSVLVGGPAMVDTERGEGIFNLSLRCHLLIQGSDL